ncbi:MAG: hypothetical protein LRY66_03285 [Saccharospirillaceae bacterium]|nr:hypothetical protein [Saccharospirillaceae bacterium]MCD8530385.1 hypothetical protein [Saccharospirillaceae bacterium]
MKLTDIPDLATKILALLFFIGLLFGGIVMFRYCLHIGYYPSGVSVSDSLFLISASLMFLIIYGCYLGLSFGLACMFLMIIKRPYNWSADVVRRWFQVDPLRIEKIDPSVSAFAPLGLLSTLLLVLLYALGHPLAIAATFTVLLHGFLLLLLSSVTLESPEPLMDAVVVVGDPKSKRRVAVKWGMISFVIVLPLVLSGAFNFLSQMTMQSIGVRIERVEVGLSGKSAAFVRQAISESDAEPKGQGNPAADELLLLKNAEVLWTGVGSHTAVRFRDLNEEDFFIFPNKEVLMRHIEKSSNKRMEPTR